MTHSDSLDQLATALSAFQAEVEKIPKDSTNPFFKSKYAGLPQVVATASPMLTKHGLSVAQFIGHDGDGNDTLTTWVLHKSGQFICESMRLHLVKDDPQGQGSATTYARRYSYMAALGLVADEDDDGQAASRRRPARAAASAPVDPSAPPLASPQERAAIKARAEERSVPPTDLALTLVRAAGGDESKYAFDSRAAAAAWVDKALERLPKAYVKAVLTELDAVLV